MKSRALAMAWQNYTFGGRSGLCGSDGYWITTATGITFSSATCRTINSFVPILRDIYGTASQGYAYMDELQRGNNSVDRFQWNSENDLRLVSAGLTLVQSVSSAILPFAALQCTSNKRSCEWCFRKPRIIAMGAR
ncbi:hypothetical protein ACJ73_04116 [Blastomyces percursus]|uniref:Uncharacterized protein n=1 Tax=Blastomyces percursus TaxID=1658174 RepID=A0A1J9Q7T9_9EURO|nr:hypothetical protein ACJ73_04116 [Blastomyces percursus]